MIPCFIPDTLSELEQVLNYDKFVRQRQLLPFSIEDFLLKLRQYILLFPRPKRLPEIIRENKIDNAFLACAIISGARAIVSGYWHLLGLKSFHNIPILTPKEFLGR